MKTFLTLFLFVIGLGFSTQAAQAGMCKCNNGNPSNIEGLNLTTEQGDCCLRCAEKAVQDNRSISRSATWQPNTSNDSGKVNLACGEIHFCWCAKRDNENGCFLAGSFSSLSNVIASTQQCQTTCAQQTANYGTISRWFDSNYVDRTGTNSTNACGEYCWCNKPTAESGDQTTCELHRSITGKLPGMTIPLRGEAECRSVCESLNVGSRRGSMYKLETTYVNRTGRACDAPANAPNGVPPGTNAPTITPPPTIRLFNPLGSATNVVDIINRFIKMMMGLVGAGALAMFVYGGVKWMLAAEDTKAVSEAKSILKNSTFGILLLVFAYSIVATFFSVIGG